MTTQPYHDHRPYLAPTTRAAGPMATKTVRIHDTRYRPEVHGSQSAFTSNEFAEEDDYYGAHLGAAADDLQEEEY